MKTTLRPIVILVVTLCCFFGQQPAGRGTEKVEDVVLNRKTPSAAARIHGFRLEKIFEIDTENPVVRDIGIPDIFGFDVDTKGRIIVLRDYKGDGPFLFLFDERGRFIKSFGRQGQGPGELQNPRDVAFDNKDNILICDLGTGLSRYDKEGVFLGKAPAEKIIKFAAGPGSGLLGQFTGMGSEGDKFIFSTSVQRLGPDFRPIARLDELRVDMKPSDFRPIEPLLCWAVSRDRTFVLNEQRGYEIRVYDGNAKLVRVIRKEFDPVPISEAERQKILKPFSPQMKEAFRFSGSHTPFQSVAASDEGRLLVATFEPGNGPGEFLFDLFDENGHFAAKKSLSARIWEGTLWIRMKGDKFYSLREKDDGFKTVEACRMTWE